MGLDPAEPGLRPAGVPPPEQAQVGVAILLPHDALGAEVRGYTRPTHGIVPPGKTHSPSPAGLSYARGLQVLFQQNQRPVEFSADEG